MIFQSVTTESTAQFAGSYRGSPDRCLSSMTVEFGGEVGTSPDRVSYQMIVFGQRARSYLRRLGKSEIDANHRSTLRATIAAQLFTDFIFVHPFADGNGHTARAMVAMIYLSDKARLTGWPVEPRSNSVDYVDLAQKFRKGEMKPFVDLLLSSSGAV
ncbi:MAG: Fic family protein [Alkalispirochaeta sp.]